MKFITALFLGTASIGALAVGCSVKATDSLPANPTADAGKDATGQPDSGAKADSSAPDMCAPDLTGFTDPTYVPANKEAACTAADIEASYVACWGSAATEDTCKAWYEAAANKVCDACLVGYEDDTKLRPTIVTDTSVYFNTAGCLELSGVSQSCVTAYNTAVACGDFACTPCYEAGAAASSPDGEELSDAEWAAVDGCYAAAEKGACAARYTAAACATDAQVKACTEPDYTDEKAWKAFYVQISTSFCGK